MTGAPDAAADVEVAADPGTGVAVIRLARPGKLNALRSGAVRELDRVIGVLEADPDCRVLVLAGRGRAFCSGADRGERADFTPDSRRRFIAAGRATLARLRSSPLISVAALHGYVLGGGLELAMSCDLRVADEGTLLGLPEVTLGHLPGWDGPALLSRLVGRGRALDLVLTGERLGASAALAAGLVDEVTPDGTAFAAALDRARRYAAAPAAVTGRVKQALDLAPDLDPAPRLAPGPGPAAPHPATEHTESEEPPCGY
ncbi:MULTISPECIES: enoyl-CoA hydratase/isomerase family protein [unclassified Streptomyces]|uniref:enoyl-CoA hydratase/isomerase family protein n=1 Tax=unclassified Streptomyces TaxID=2593676 RepID=UPI002E2DC716|nr:enoyl-CoA hydratase/isomerase family protein [Streptomyces sp. NBC_00223]